MRIGVVGTDPSDVTWLATLFGHAGHEVTTGDDVAAAMMLATTRGAVDLLVLDEALLATGGTEGAGLQQALTAASCVVSAFTLTPGSASAAGAGGRARSVADLVDRLLASTRAP